MERLCRNIPADFVKSWSARRSPARQQGSKSLDNDLVLRNGILIEAQPRVGERPEAIRVRRSASSYLYHLQAIPPRQPNFPNLWTLL